MFVYLSSTIGILIGLALAVGKGVAHAFSTIMLTPEFEVSSSTPTKTLSSIPSSWKKVLYGFWRAKAAYRNFIERLRETVVTVKVHFCGVHALADYVGYDFNSARNFVGTKMVQIRKRYSWSSNSVSWEVETKTLSGQAQPKGIEIARGMSFPMMISEIKCLEIFFIKEKNFSVNTFFERNPTVWLLLRKHIKCVW